VPFSSLEASTLGRELLPRAAHGFELRHGEGRTFFLAAAKHAEATKWQEDLLRVAGRNGAGRVFIHSRSSSWFAEAWQPFYCLVQDDTLLAYMQPADIVMGKCPQRVWNLRSTRCTLLQDQQASDVARSWASLALYGFELQQSDSGENWQFSVRSQEEQSQWLTALCEVATPSPCIVSRMPTMHVESETPPCETLCEETVQEPCIMTPRSKADGEGGLTHVHTSASVLSSNLDSLLAPVNESDLHSLFGTPRPPDFAEAAAMPETPPRKVDLVRNWSVRSDPSGEASDALEELRKRPSPLLLRPTSFSFSQGQLERLCEQAVVSGNSEEHTEASTGGSSGSSSPKARRAESSGEDVSSDDEARATQNVSDLAAPHPPNARGSCSSGSFSQVMDDWDDWRADNDPYKWDACPLLPSRKKSERCLDRLGDLESQLAEGVRMLSHELEATEEDCTALLSFFGYEVPTSRQGLASMVGGLLEALEAFQRQVVRSWAELRQHEETTMRQTRSSLAGARSRIERRKSSIVAFADELEIQQNLS